MDNVLFVTPTRKSADMLVGLLQDDGHHPRHIRITSSGSEARRAFIDCDFELVIINTPLPDEFGHELAEHIASVRNASVVMLVKSEMADTVAHQLEPQGVFILSKPLNRLLFHQIIRVSGAVRQHIMSLTDENRRLRQKLDDLRIISRAKCLLIQEENMTEPEAHSYIEKNAMNHRKTRREVAEIILQTYE